MAKLQFNNEINIVNTFKKAQFNNNNSITNFNKIQYNNGNSIQTIFNYSPYKIFGVAIDENNSNPLTRCTYTDDAVGMTKGSSAWDNMPIFSDVVDVLRNQNGTENELNKTNLAQFASGGAADITSGNAGDVFSRIPRHWGSIKRVGAVLYVKVSNRVQMPPQTQYTDWNQHGFSLATEGDCSHAYIGAYSGYELSGKLRSLSGKKPTASQAWGQFNTLCNANGAGYQMLGHHQITALQCLFVIRYGSTDSQTALGRGYADGNSASTATGGTNTKGMYFGETTGKQQMKFAGIEDFWGNLYQWYGGLVTNANRDILTAYSNFNTTGSGYVNNGQGATGNVGGYLSTVQGTSRAGFVAKATLGSSTAFYADYASLSASCLPNFGGAWTDGAVAGAFNARVNYSAAFANANIGSRLCFLKKG